MMIWIDGRDWWGPCAEPSISEESCDPLVMSAMDMGGESGGISGPCTVGPGFSGLVCLLVHIDFCASSKICVASWTEHSPWSQPVVASNLGFLLCTGSCVAHDI